MVFNIADTGALGNLLSGNRVTSSGSLNPSTGKRTTSTSTGTTTSSPSLADWAASRANPGAPYISATAKAKVDAEYASKQRDLAIQKAMSDQTAAILAASQQRAAEFAAQPKFIYRDTNAAWQNAQNTAASSINPVYVDKMNQFLLEQKNYLAQTTAETVAGKTASDVSLGQTQEDIATGKTRTAEDTATAIAQNQANEGAWQTTEGATNTAEE
jgi:hypothetical protein